MHVICHTVIDLARWILMLFFLYLCQTYILSDSDIYSFRFCNVQDYLLLKSSAINMYGLCVTLWQIWRALMLFFLYLSQTYSFCSVPDSFLSKSSAIDMYGLCVTLWQIWLSIDVILFIFITDIFSLQCSRALIQYKMSSYQYRKSHCEDKTILRLSYLHNGISFTGKMTSLYWIGAQVLSCWSLVILICKAYVSHCDRSVCGGPISDSQWEVVLSYPGFVPSIAVAWFRTLNLRVQQDFSGSPQTFWMMSIFFLILFFSLNFFCQNSRGINVKHDLFISKTVLDLLNGSHI